VVRAGDRDFWVLADGFLRHTQLAIDREKGIRLVEKWKLTNRLGSPIQGGQAGSARDAVLVVTESGGGRDFLATAVEAHSGAIRWQRRLGLQCDDDSRLVGEQVIVQDRHGATHLFEPTPILESSQRWQVAGRLVGTAPTNESIDQSAIVENADGTVVYGLAWSRGNDRLHVCRHQRGAEPVVKTFRVRHPLAGTPAATADCVYAPLGDGTLWRFPMDDKPARSTSWRGAWTSLNALGHVVHLGSDQLLTTDGGRGLTRWTWPLNADSPKREATVELPERIAGAPVLLPPGLPGSERFVAVADELGTIRLLRVDDLRTVRQWEARGKVTNGLYSSGKHIGCVLNQTRLRWIDPTKDESWEHDTQGEGIAGRPMRVGAWILVADRSGAIASLDPETGKAQAKPYQLEVSAVPSATPVPFGPDHTFVPLSDGTVMVIPLETMQKRAE
jgi:hypothetical protein